MAQTTILITGPKSGIGRNLLAAYVSRDDVLAIAAFRDGPDSDPAKDLQTIPTGKGSKIISVKYDAGSETSAQEMVSYLASEYNITSLDIVIANAGILKQWGPVREVASEDILEHFTIHTLGPIRLYKATAPLLDKSQQTPKFFIISSALGSNALMNDYAPMKLIAYGMAKAAVNFAASRIHREEEKIVVVPVQPGWIATDMGSRAAVMAGMNPNDPPVKMEDSIAGLLNVFDHANKEEYSGRFWNQKNEILAW